MIGAEAQYSWLTGNGGNGVVFPGNTIASASTDQIGSVTGRLGYAWGPTLLYAKGGYAWRNNDNINVAVAGVAAPFTVDRDRRDGWTVGAGLEYMFAPNWSIKGEYQYYNFGDTTFLTGPAPIVGAKFRDDEHTVKLGINYRFGWGWSGGRALLSQAEAKQTTERPAPSRPFCCKPIADCEIIFAKLEPVAKLSLVMG